MASALAMADSIIKGMLPDPTLGATHYANLDLCNPAWAQGATLTIKIGRHSFYKDVA